MDKVASRRSKEINQIRMPSSPGSTDSSSPHDTSDEETHDVYHHNGAIQGLDGKGEKSSLRVYVFFLSLFFLHVVVAALLGLYCWVLMSPPGFMFERMS